MAERDKGGELTQWWEWINKFRNRGRGVDWFTPAIFIESALFYLPKWCTFEEWKKRKDKNHG
jgi:hypothetical protein